MAAFVVEDRSWLFAPAPQPVDARYVFCEPLAGRHSTIAPATCDAHGVGFFDQLPPPPPADEPEEYRPPEWLAPPENVVGRFADVGAALVRGPDVAIAADGFVAYPTGVELHMTMLSRRLDYQMDPFFGGYRPRSRHGDVSSDVLRVGFQLFRRYKGDLRRLALCPLDRRRCSRWACTQPRGRRRRRSKLARVALALAAPAGGAADPRSGVAVTGRARDLGAAVGRSATGGGGPRHRAVA